MDLDYWRGLVGPEDLETYRRARLPRRVGYGKSVAVLVVDMTNLFIDDKYVTGCGARGWDAVTAWATLLEAARSRGLPIFYSRRNRRTSRVDQGVTSLKWGFTSDALYLTDPEADEFPAQIAPREGDVIIEKGKPSSFFETPLRSMLTFLGVDTLIAGGVGTSNCVRCTVTDAFACNYRVIIPAECCADRAMFAHRANLFDMDMKYGDVEPLSAVLQYVESLPGGVANVRT